MVRIVLVAVVLLLPSAGATLATPDGSGAIVEREQVRLVRIPVLLEAREPGGCEDLRPEWIEVLEDGAAVAATHLDPKRLEAVHAILLDTSRSMLDSLQEAKAAAIRYMESLPRNELALIATFDDSLVLHAPLSTNRAELKNALSWIDTGLGTNLWDSSRQMIDYLRSRPERKVLVVITDGCDLMRAGVSPAEVVERASQTESLVVFPIGLDLPTDCRRKSAPSGDPVKMLKRLARETGGEFNHLQSASELKSILPAVRERMEREKYITYQPLAFGEGPKDHAEKRTYRWRKVDIRLRHNVPCSISIAGSKVRYESASRGYFARTPDHSEDVVNRAFQPDDAPGLTRGEVRDRTKDVGPLLADACPEELPQRCLIESLKSETEVRKVAAIVPPLDRVVRSDARPEDGLVQELAQVSRGKSGLERPPGGWNRWTEVPFLLNGRTLLAARKSLAEALFTQPDYGRWARQKVRDERMNLLEELERFGGVERADEMRTALREPSWRPDPHELEKHLGAWLDDVDARDVFLFAETWMSRRLLKAAAKDGPVGAEAVLQEAERFWEDIAVWLPPPTEVRVMGVLVPGYDPFRDVVGFHRVVLPRPESFRRVWHFSYDAPLGVRLVRWMAGRRTLSRMLQEGLEVRSVRYDEISSRDLRHTLEKQFLDDALEPGRAYPGRSVTVTFSPTDDPGRRIRIRALLAVDGLLGDLAPYEPVCLLSPEDSHGPGVRHPFIDAVLEAQQHSSVPCLLEE